MSTDTETAVAALLNATRNGKLADAYRVLQNQPYKEMAPLALGAGFACISTANKQHFMAHLVGQVAEATRNRTDGYGLRNIKKAKAAG